MSQEPRDRPVSRAEYDMLIRRLENLEGKLDVTTATARRADEIVQAHQPHIDSYVRTSVQEQVARPRVIPQELSDAVQALYQLSGALQDLIRYSPNIGGAQEATRADVDLRSRS